MTAHTHTSTNVSAVPADHRLPWWGLLLPVLAFVALLALLTSGSAAPSESTAAEALGRLVEQVQLALGTD